MLQCLKREPGFYRYLWGLTGPIALQNLITFTLGLMDTLMVSWLATPRWPPSPPPTCRCSC